MISKLTPNQNITKQYKSKSSKEGYSTNKQPAFVEMSKWTWPKIPNLKFSKVSSKPKTFVFTNSGAWSDDKVWRSNRIPKSDIAKVTNSPRQSLTLEKDATVGKVVLSEDRAQPVEHLVINKGTLRTVLKSWNAVGYKGSAGVRLKDGGSWICSDRLDVGVGNKVDGQISKVTLEEGAGILATGSDLIIGLYIKPSDNIKAQVDVQGGLVFVKKRILIDPHPDCWINLSGQGVIVQPGNRLAKLQAMIDSGKIKAHDGKGQIFVSYDLSRNVTVVRALENTIQPKWRMIRNGTQGQRVVVAIDPVKDFGVVPDGKTDVTKPLQRALFTMANLGGGAVYLPMGEYLFKGSLMIPSGVTLHGEWQRPEPGKAIGGTVLMPYAGRGKDENATPFIRLSESGGVKGITVWYPEQDPDNIVSYPPTFGRGGAATIENITLVNSYFGYTSMIQGTTGRPFVRSVYGTPLKVGIEFDSIADIGRIESVHFSPTFWEESGLPGSPKSGEHRQWIYENGIGVIHRRMDWSYSCYVKVEGYHIGLALRPSRHDKKAPNGQSYRFDLVDCHTGVAVDAHLYNGSQFSRFNIQGAQTGVYFGAGTKEVSLFHTCNIEGEENAVQIESKKNARVFFSSCQFQGGPVEVKGGYVSIVGSDFTQSGTRLILEEGVKGASILGNRLGSAKKIVNRSSNQQVYIDDSPISVYPMPEYEFKKPNCTPGPNSDGFWVVTEQEFGAVSNDKADDSLSIQKALDFASRSGGGTVFVPAGSYHLKRPLKVPSGVELRGVFDIPHGTNFKGSLLNVMVGHGEPTGQALIGIESNAGVQGLTFHYPLQQYDATDESTLGLVPYPYMIQGLGSDVHVVNISATLPYQILDLYSNRCDRHYVDYIFSTCLKTGIRVGGGSKQGQLHNIQLNPNSYTFRANEYDSIPSGTSKAIHQLENRLATPFMLGDVEDQVLHQCFVFARHRGIHLTEENGRGPSGHCLGFGADACMTAFHVDAIGKKGFTPINSQIVSTNPLEGVYLKTGRNFRDSFRMISGAAWGSHAKSIDIEGGDVELSNFTIHQIGKQGTIVMNKGTMLRVQSLNLHQTLEDKAPFLKKPSSASLDMEASILRGSETEMPQPARNLEMVGNLLYR